jgi:hypothetical protein
MKLYYSNRINYQLFNAIKAFDNGKKNGNILSTLMCGYLGVCCGFFAKLAKLESLRSKYLVPFQLLNQVLYFDFRCRFGQGLA